MQWLLLSFALGLLLLVVHELVQPVDKKWSSLKKYRLPAGPRGLPVLGNLLEFWSSRSAGNLGKTFLELSSYGEMTTLHMGSTLYVLLNTNRVTKEIIDKRAKLTHERPHMPISGTLVSKGMRSVTQPTRIWTELRRMMRPLMNDTWTKKFEAWQDFESIHLLRSYLDSPTKWYLHNSRFATGVMHGVIAGGRLTKSDEQMQDYRKTTMQFLGSIQSTVVDFFPWLEYLPTPLQLWRGKWQAIGDEHYRVFKSWWEPVKQSATSEKASSSWTRDVLLSPNSQFKGSDDEAAYLTNTVISAGGDNPRIAINTCIMASIQHPNTLQRCREELEGICCANGIMRLPNVSDIPQLPYTCAFIKETLRWRPAVPMIPPHTASEDFVFEDYVFPKGTNFIVNVPATSRDYPEPEVFKPERWLDDGARLMHDFWGFGGGRRVCIGYKAAQTALFLPFSRLVLCFDFEKNGDFDDGKVNSWSPDAPFPVLILKRSAAHEQLIFSTECEQPT
ncbi:Putative cytochrome P450 [Septoria linicola]|uniref:Cytochrome P450 n=1 Tax=Septoria linicola TaxID=215465 RepID=A0A9Q9APK3_9PEZI|nr:putative cytochrome P450 [Septoria linicola]USW49731.1 Putative cytochrome P450 [Septoria linicola]